MFVWCPGAGSNHRHRDFQSRALPTELPGLSERAGRPLKRARSLTVASVAVHPVGIGRRARRCDSPRRAISAGRGPCSRGCRTARARALRACRRAGRSWLVRGFRHIRPTWEERGRRASSTAPPTCRASASSHSVLAFEHGDHRRVRDEPLRARRSRTPPGAAARGLRSGAVLRQLDQRGARTRADDLDEAEAVDRGPLERLRQTGVDRRRRGLARRLAARGRQVDADRAADVEAADRVVRLRAAPSTASSSGGKIAVDVDQGHRRGRRHPQLAAGEADHARCAPRRSDRPSRPRRSSIRRCGERRARVRSSGGAQVRLLLGDLRQRPLPRLGAGDRLAGDLDGRSSRPAAAPGAPRGSRYSAPRCRDRDRVAAARSGARPAARRSTLPAGVSAVAARSRASMISPSSTSAARVSPIPRSISHSGNRISRATSAARASRRAAGRRRWNSCRRCGGHRPRHSPGAHSRRPCRAIRRGRRNSRSRRR